jgi:hypothetical protein
VPRRPSVIWFVEGGPENPCPFYRGFLPARALQLRAWPTFVTGDGVVADDGRFTSESLDRPTDIAVIRRPVGADGVNGVDYSEQVAAARAAGQRVFVDVDDNLWSLPPTSPAREILTRASLDAFAATMNAAEGVICTTRGLAVALDDVGITVPVHVCGNGIDPSLFPFREGEHTPLRVGWLGPWKWRNDDLASIAGWLVPFLNARAGAVEFWHLGVMPRDEGKVEDVLSGLTVPVQKVPWVPFPALPQSLAVVDVLVIPQRRGGAYEAFANARSPSSAIAAIASGAVVWATPISSYRDFFGDALPSDLGMIVDDKARRRQYRRAQKRLLERVNLAATAAAYEKAFA